MLKKIFAFAALALVIGTLAPTESRAQIVNGNFDVGNPLTDWNASGSISVLNTGAQSPTQSILFSSGSATLSQTFSAVAGQYFLSFYMRAISTAPVALATIRVLVNGQEFGGATIGSEYGRTLTAAVSLQTNGNTIQFFNANATNGNLVQLDTVSFQAVPAPVAGGGLLSFAAAGLLVGWSLRRKQKKAA